MEPKPLQVLLVDDDPNMLATMADILKSKGFEPSQAQTAAAADTTPAGRTILCQHLGLVAGEAEPVPWRTMDDRHEGGAGQGV